MRRPENPQIRQTRRYSSRFNLLATTFLILSCKQRAPKKPPSTHSTQPVQPARERTTQAAASTKKTKGSADQTRDQVQQSASRLLKDWIDAQNQQDFSRYLSHYWQPKFRGVKRTVKGPPKTFNFSTWKVDRERMFQSRMNVAADNVKITSWHDNKRGLRPGSVEIRFTQRWQNNRYADHGPKLLRLWSIPKTTGLKIVYEDLLSSASGWGLGTMDKDSDGQHSQTWATMDIRYRNYVEKLSKVPKHRRSALARDLIDTGNFKCSEVLEADVCGEVEKHWKSLEPNTDITDPCLRRLIAPWAIDQLTDKDIVTLSSKLVALMSLPVPETALQSAVLKRVMALKDQSFASSLRVELLLAASDYFRQSGEPVSFAGLSEQARRTLLLKGHYNELAGKVSLDATQLQQVASDNGFSRETRVWAMKEWSRVFPTQGKSQLLTLVHDQDCEVAYVAARALAKLGDERFLPAKQTKNRARALCMLIFDEDQARFLKTWRTFIDPKQGLNITTTVENDFERMEAAGDGSLQEVPEEKYIEKTSIHMTADNASDQALPERADLQRVLEGREDKRDEGAMMGRPRVDLTWQHVEGKPWYLKSISIYKWLGCPC